MSTKQRVYLGEWLDFLGTRQSELAVASGRDAAHISTIVKKGTCSSVIRRKFEIALGLDAGDLLKLPYIKEDKKTVPVFDLADWLKDSQATYNGLPLTEQARKDALQLLELFFKNRR